MASYISKYTGDQIDRAVAYYLAMDTPGRVIISVTVGSSGQVNWQKLSGATRWEHQYACQISAQGVAAISNAKEPPLIYFIDSAGTKWDLDYEFDITISNDIRIINSVTCYSNSNKDGEIVIVSVLSDVDSSSE